MSKQFAQIPEIKPAQIIRDNEENTRLVQISDSLSDTSYQQLLAEFTALSSDPHQAASAWIHTVSTSKKPKTLQLSGRQMDTLACAWLQYRLDLQAKEQAWMDAQ